MGNSSKLAMDLAPWRRAVPTQSLPVSPPPITITMFAGRVNAPGQSIARHQPILLGPGIPWRNECRSIRGRGWQIAGLRGAAAQHNGVEGLEFVDGDIRARRHAGFEHDAFLFEDIQPAVQHPFFQFEIGNAVTQQAAETVGALEEGDRMSGAIQLLGAGQSGRSRSDDGDFFPVR